MNKGFRRACVCLCVWSTTRAGGRDAVDATRHGDARGGGLERRRVCARARERKKGFRAIDARIRGAVEAVVDAR